jgi:hypothetical protein
MALFPASCSSLDPSIGHADTGCCGVSVAHDHQLHLSLHMYRHGAKQLVEGNSAHILMAGSDKWDTVSSFVLQFQF